ncbi:hypothetical protein ABZ690_33090, partial [Streptomyces sp. NPDC006967]|uniref:hypothetical protein n=1 Tax=Streptomyces sp. NPDC006967 TaxID=3156906 RepID=UPI0033CD01DB
MQDVITAVAGLRETRFLRATRSTPRKVTTDQMCSSSRNTSSTDVLRTLGVGCNRTDGRATRALDIDIPVMPAATSSKPY